ncbi:MAG TPA: AAA family ATPase [Streptosporangiaceae bacterium]
MGSEPHIDAPSGSAEPLVGRQAECAVLDRMLTRLAGGSAQVLEVTGDPGIGKTRLLAELARRARDRGFLVLVGQARYSGGQQPFEALIDAVDEHLAGFGEDHDGLDLPSLASVFPSLRGQDGTGAKAKVERHRLFREVRTLLAALASPGLVLILDDLHRADDDTVEWLVELLHRPPRRPVLLALAHRWRQAPARLLAAVKMARTHEPPASLHLGPLTEDAADVLLAGTGSRSSRRALYRESQGNPFYLDALIRSAGRGLPVPDGTPPHWADVEGELPPAVIGALMAEFEWLSPAGQLAARSAAVIGDPFSVETVSIVAGADGDSTAAAVAEMATADLVRPVERSRLFAFRHGLVRSAIYESVNPAWRGPAHARAAQALRDSGAPLTSQAHHVERAASPGEFTAVETLTQAASTVHAHAPATAARWLQAALKLLPETPEASPQRTSLLLRLAFALGVAGHPKASRDTLHDLLQPLRGDPERRIPAVAFCAVMERLLCRHAEGHALLLAELPKVGDEESLTAATLKFELGCSALTGGDPMAGRMWAQEALTAARASGHTPLRAAVLGLIATACGISGDVQAAGEHLDPAVRLLDGMLDGELARRPDAAVWIGWSEFFLERPGEALRHFDRALTIARERGRVLVLPPLLTGKILVLRGIGRLADASLAAEEAVDVALLSGSDEQRAAALAMRCWVATWTGDFDLASRAGAAAVEHRPRPATGWIAALATRMLAEAHLAMGDHQGCLDLVDLAGGPQLSTADAHTRIGWYELLTRAELAAGRQDAASIWAEAAVGAARGFGQAGRQGLAMLARAQALAATEPAAALRLATAARDAMEKRGMVLDAARAAVVAGQAHAACGDPEAAAAELQAAKSVFDVAGAGPLARNAAACQRRVAVRASHGPVLPRQRRPGVLPALTRRESQVALLVSGGLTNRRIARQLKVAEKTVEMHLANVFTKFGVGSRTEVAAAVIRAEEPGPADWG